jgi:hypothetical protein
MKTINAARKQILLKLIGKSNVMLDDILELTMQICTTQPGLLYLDKSSSASFEEKTESIQRK